MDDRASTYTRGWSGHDPSFLSLPDGSRLRYLKIGQGDPLVLIHTVRTQLDLFQRLIPLLADRYTIYALDLPGFGWSPIVPGAAYTEPALRARVIAFIQALGLEEAVLAGESIGAVLAMTAAADKALRPRRVVAFNLYDYRPGVERANMLASLIINSVRAPVFGPVFAAMENRLILKGILRGGFADPDRLPEDFVDELSRSGARSGYAQVARAVYRALPGFIAARALYPDVAAPVTLVYGDRDWSRPDEREANRRLIGPAHSVTLPDTGHFAAMENPDACAQALL